jgi:hypothetical protein
MIIYYFMMLSWLVYAAVIYSCLSKPSAFTVAALPFLTIFLIVGLRGIEVGTDTLGYISEFQDADSRYRFTEFGFSYFNKFIHNVGSGATLFLLTVSLITTGSIAWVIHKFSKNITLSYLLYLNLGYMAFAMSGIRQAIAISITSVALIFLIKNQKIVFSALVLLAATFHNTALIFILVLPFVWIVLTRLQATGVFIILFITPFFIGDGLLAINNMFGLTYMNEYLGDASSSNPLVVIIAVLIPLIALFFWPKGKGAAMYSTFFLLSSAAMWFSVASLDFQMIGRIGLYFNVYAIVFLPNIVERIRPVIILMVARASLLFLAICHFSISTPGNSIGIDKYAFGIF